LHISIVVCLLSFSATSGLTHYHMIFEFPWNCWKLSRRGHRTYHAECSEFSTLRYILPYISYLRRYKSVDRNNWESVRYVNARHRHRRDCSKEH